MSIVIGGDSIPAGRGVHFASVARDGTNGRDAAQEATAALIELINKRIVGPQRGAAIMPGAIAGGTYGSIAWVEMHVESLQPFDAGTIRAATGRFEVAIRYSEGELTISPQNITDWADVLSPIGSLRPGGNAGKIVGETIDDIGNALKGAAEGIRNLWEENRTIFIVIIAIFGALLLLLFGLYIWGQITVAKTAAGALSAGAASGGNA